MITPPTNHSTELRHLYNALARAVESEQRYKARAAELERLAATLARAVSNIGAEALATIPSATLAQSLGGVRLSNRDAEVFKSLASTAKAMGCESSATRRNYPSA